MTRYAKQNDIPEYDIGIITDSKHMADLFEQTTDLCKQPKKVSNWLMGETLRLLKEKSMDPEDIIFSPVNLAKLIELVDTKAITGTVAKEVFEIMFDMTVNDEGELRKTIEEVIINNPKSVEDYRNGKEKAIGFLVGQTMKAMKGKADAGLVNQIIKEVIG